MGLLFGGITWTEGHPSSAWLHSRFVPFAKVQSNPWLQGKYQYHSFLPRQSCWSEGAPHSCRPHCGRHEYWFLFYGKTTFSRWFSDRPRSRSICLSVQLGMWGSPSMCSYPLGSGINMMLLPADKKWQVSIYCHDCHFWVVYRLYWICL